MGEINSFVSGFLDIIRANAAQFFIFAGVLVSAFLTYLATNGGNRVKSKELTMNKEVRERESRDREETKAREIALSESQLTIKRQEDLYERTYKLIATLEQRLESQVKQQHQEREEFRQEREGLRVEIRGFRAQVRKLERRVSQLVTAFRETTGKEPPPEIEDPDDNGHH